MKNYLIVFGGAAFGGIARYWLSNFVYKFLPASFPYGTLVVNIVGSFILGFIFFTSQNTNYFSPEVRLFLTIGLCGGFTTFSTFSLETFTLILNADYFSAALNILFSVFLCFVAVLLSYFFVKYLIGA